jgi:predicted amino acid dehydrogenase
VVAAVGRAELVKGHWLKPGVVVIDVGVNSVDDASKKTGRLRVLLLSRGGVSHHSCPWKSGANDHRYVTAKHC